MNNMSRNHIVDINGVKKTISEWADYYKIEYWRMQNLLKKNKLIWRRLIFYGINRKYNNRIIYNYNISIAALEQLTGVPLNTPVGQGAEIIANSGAAEQLTQLGGNQ